MPARNPASRQFVHLPTRRVCSLQPPMILVLDNRDSFVHNLARYVRLAGVATEVVRSTDLTVDDVLSAGPRGVVLSPGPGRPADAGICTALLRAAPMLPIYGVCLGHQCLAEAYGGQTLRSGEPTHGRATAVRHTGDAMFAGVPPEFTVGRYHSLTVDLAAAPEIVITAVTARGEVMAMRHRSHPHWGVQFHPESLLTPEGQRMVDTFVALCRSRTRSGTGATA